MKLVPIIFTLFIFFCSDRERLNPLDPSNPVTHGVPQDLELSSNKKNISIRWSKINNNSITGYNIWRTQSDQEKLTLVKTLPEEFTSTSDTVFYYDTTFSYRLSAITDSWESPKTNPQSIIPGPFNYWIADYYQGIVSRISYDGAHVLSQNYIYTPIAIDIDPVHKILWLGRASPPQIVRFDFNGEAQLMQELISSPIDIAVDSTSGDVFVANLSATELKHFNYKGELINSIPCNLSFSNNTQIVLDPIRKTVWVLVPDSAEVVKVNWESPVETVIFPDMRLSRTISIMPSIGYTWIATDSGVVYIDEKNTKQHLLSQYMILDIDINDEEKQVWAIVYDKTEYQYMIQVIEQVDQSWVSKSFDVGHTSFFSRIKVNPGSKNPGILLYDNQEKRLLKLDRDGNLIGTLPGFSSRLDIIVEQ